MPGRKYLYTERAHYMSPNMHFGIMAEIGSEFDADGIIESIGVLRSAHPLMRSLIAEEEGSSMIYYEEHPELEIPITIKEADDNWQTDYEAVSSAGWNVQKEALLTRYFPSDASGLSVKKFECKVYGETLSETFFECDGCPPRARRGKLFLRETLPRLPVRG